MKTKSIFAGALILGLALAMPASFSNKGRAFGAATGGAGQDRPAVEAGTLTDARDGKVYKTVKISNQWWMAENLNYDIGGSCCFNDDPSLSKTYGRLYDWASAKAACPSGWHLPTDEEWKMLEKHLGMSAGDADKRGWRLSGNISLKLKSTNDWNDNANGTNESGFNALPGGWKEGPDGPFHDLGTDGDFWTATEFDAFQAWARLIVSDRPDVGRYPGPKNAARSVRCVKDY